MYVWREGVLLGMFPYSLKEAQEKDVLPRPLDIVVWGCDAWSHCSHLATMRIQTWRQRATCWGWRSQKIERNWAADNMIGPLNEAEYAPVPNFILCEINALMWFALIYSKMSSKSLSWKDSKLAYSRPHLCHRFPYFLTSSSFIKTSFFKNLF